MSTIANHNVSRHASRRTGSGWLPRRLGIAALAAAPILGMSVALATPASADPPATITKPFGYTGSEQTFTVPAGVAFLNLTLDGGSGGSAVDDVFGGGTGGLAGEVIGTMQVKPGDRVMYFVGQAGSRDSAGTGGSALQGGSGGDSGSDLRGGGGGAATAVYLNGTLVAVAGGGGGGGGGGSSDGSSYPNGGSGGVGTGSTGSAGIGVGAGAGGAGGGGSPTGATTAGVGYGGTGGGGGGGGGGYPQSGTGGSAGGIGNGGGGGGGGGGSYTGGLFFEGVAPSPRGAGSDGQLTVSYKAPVDEAWASANPSTATQGQKVTYSAKVADYAGVTQPQGTVSFSVGSTQLCTFTLGRDQETAAAGSGSCQASNAPLGTDTVVASYSGDGTFPKNSQTTFTETVSVGTTTAVSVNPLVAHLGDLVKYTATVHPASGTAIPTGTVTFTTGSTQLCDNPIPLDATGQAVCESSKTPLGGGFVTATYSGAPGAPGALGFTGSTGMTTKMVTVGTTTAVTASSPASSEGDLVKYRATVHSVSGTAIPTGTVMFTTGSTQLCNNPIPLDATGQAECKSTKAPLGSGTVTATYSGTRGFIGSTGTTTETISARATALATTTSVTADPPTSAPGSPVTYTATVRPPAGKTTPTGTVSFTAGTTKLCTAAVAVNGVGNAKCVSPRAPVGTDTVTATYQPADGSFTGSTGTTTETVSKPAAAGPTKSPATP